MNDNINAIQIEKMSYYYNESSVLLNINLQINKAELVFCKGHSGAGKSTLLQLLSLEKTPAEGSIMVHNINTTLLTKNERQFYRRKIGIINQIPTFISAYNVADNIALPLKISGYSSYEITKRVRIILAKVGLDHKAYNLPHQLSQGEKQRAEIARALINKPLLVLADEPTGNLDSDNAQAIYDILYQFNKAGTSMLIATHDSTLLNSTEYRIITLHQGKIIADTHNKIITSDLEEII